MTLTLTNNRTNETLSTEMSLPQLASRFSEIADQGHWAWYWMLKAIRESEEAPQRKDMIAFLADSFLFAIGMGLKKPMIRLHYWNRRFKWYLSARGTLCLKGGAIHPETKDPVGDEVYVGCLYAGRFLPNKERPILREEGAFLERMATDPVAFMAEASKDMGRCCYCNQPLEDPRSKDVGYGETCAGRWGLPWGASYDEKVPSFAQLWGRAEVGSQKDMRAMCQAIRKAPRDSLLWDVLSDILEENGHTKRLAPPEGNVIIPAA